MAKTKKQLKIEQANMQSDVKDMGYSDGIQYVGEEFIGEDPVSYSFADLDDDFDMNVGTVSTGFTIDGIAMDNEEELRKKYPALQDAWEHYKNVKNMCEQKERENED